MRSTGEVDRIERAFLSAQGVRHRFEGGWQDVIAHVAPTRAFDGPNDTGQRQFDTTAALAAENLAAGLYGMTTNPATSWFDFEVRGQEDKASRDWLCEAADEVGRALRSSACGFYPAVLELFRDCVLFGTGLLALEWQDGALRCSGQPLNERWLVNDDRGQLAAVFRQLSFSARDYVRRWPERVSGQVDEERHYTVINLLATARHARAMGLEVKASERRVLSIYLDRDSRQVLSRSWFQEMPISALRWSGQFGVAAGGAYGISPAVRALPDIKLSNALTRASVTASELAVDPPLLTVNENGLRGMKTHPGAIIYGGLDPSGRRLYEPLAAGAVDGAASLSLLASKQDQVREAFFFSLLLFANDSKVTATEFLGRYEEKVRLFAPYLARIQAELLEPTLLRALRLMVRAGALSPPPALRRALLTPRDFGSQVTIGIRSPLAQAQSLSQGTSLLRSVQAASSVMEQLPEIETILDRKALAEQLLEGLSLPTLKPLQEIEHAEP